MRPIVKVLRSLVDIKNLNNDIQEDGTVGGNSAESLLNKGRSIRRSIDDNAIPYLSRYGIITTVSKDEDIKTKITALVFLKTLRSEFSATRPRRILAGGSWKTRRPFWNTSSIKNIVWWKYLGNVSLTRAKTIITREIIDHLYQLIYVKRIPIIGVRIVLVDWRTGNPIDPDILKDEWYSDTGFNGLKVDKLRLKSWGINISDMSPDPHQKTQFKFSNDNRFDKNNLDLNELNNMFDKYQINIKSIISFAIVNATVKFASYLDNNTRNKINNKLNVLARSEKFEEQIKEFIIKKLQDDKSFREEFMMEEHKKNVINPIVNQVINEYIDQQVLLNH